MSNSQVLQAAHLDEQVETAIYQFIQDRVLHDREYTLYDVEKHIIGSGWGYLPTQVFLQCYRKAVNYFADQMSHPQESLV